MLVLIANRVNKKTARKMHRLNKRKNDNRQDTIDGQGEKVGPVRGPGGNEAFFDK